MHYCIKAPPIRYNTIALWELQEKALNQLSFQCLQFRAGHRSHCKARTLLKGVNKKEWGGGQNIARASTL